MPIIWLMREGGRPNIMNDPGVALSFMDFQRGFSDWTPKYLSKTPPEFNVAAPTPDVQHVVIEVEPNEGNDLTFPFAGYYLIPDMTPADVKEELSELFSSVTRSSKPAPKKK
jgi:hypothetical protein